MAIGKWGGGGDGGEVSDIAHSSYSRHQILSDTQQYFPSKDIALLPHLPASKKLLEEQIFEEQIHWVPLYIKNSSCTNYFAVKAPFSTLEHQLLIR